MVAPVIPALSDDELESILLAAAKAGASAAGYILLRLPGEVHALFEEWLSAHAPLKAGRVMRLLRDMRGGKAYDSRFGERQTGSGAYAEMIAGRFEAAIRRYGLKAEESQLDCSQFRVPTDQLSLF
jgi:DNA repair photolyase